MDDDDAEVRAQLAKHHGCSCERVPGTRRCAEWDRIYRENLSRLLLQLSEPLIGRGYSY